MRRGRGAYEKFPYFRHGDTAGQLARRTNGSKEGLSTRRKGISWVLGVASDGERGEKKKEKRYPYDGFVAMPEVGDYSRIRNAKVDLSGGGKRREKGMSIRLEVFSS